MNAGNRIAQAERSKGCEQAYNHHGQKIGSKGERTRQALIDATVELLESRGLRDVSVVDVARAAKTSPATFYVYFRGVPEVVLAALETASQTSPELEDLVSRDWLAGDGTAAAAQFVEAYTKLWNRNRTIFRVRNLAAEEGDNRFYEARMKAAGPMVAALAATARRAQDAGRLPAALSPRACAGTLLMMLERLAAIGPITEEGEGLGYGPLKQAAAHTVAAMLGAR
ncbi:TetR family transcriptional regulator [Novosphingobium kunmingense]|uniref:TetR family transcriptional regulator n=1 Tax=Novosphingobium kunmingense TaxID=1211806 RepID=A0A2N0H621_9SPHN|nr:TetR family transcriptional regulator [Novosphingobium kunmingense]PKB14360.1 TetR family transcriptional regulator [Novosphingobium kunmingense]